MNALELARLLGDLPDEMITESDAAFYPRRRIRLAAVSAAAACIVLLIAAAVYPRIRVEKPPAVTETQTALTTTLTTPTDPNASAETTAPTADSTHSADTTRTESTAQSTSGSTAPTATETGTTASDSTTAATAPTGTASRTTVTTTTVSGTVPSDTTFAKSDITYPENSTRYHADTTGFSNETTTYCEEFTGVTETTAFMYSETVLLPHYAQTVSVPGDTAAGTSVFGFRTVTGSERTAILAEMGFTGNAADYDLLSFTVSTDRTAAALTGASAADARMQFRLTVLDEGSSSGVTHTAFYIPVPRSWRIAPLHCSANCYPIESAVRFAELRAQNQPLNVTHYFREVIL